MACGSCGQKAEKKPYFEVVAASGKVIYTTPNEATANSLARKYSSAQVRKVGGG